MKLFKIHHLLIDFSGEKLPICSKDELRLASVLACAYHNSCVRENIKDSTYEPHTAEIACEDPVITMKEAVGGCKKVSNYRLRKSKAQNKKETLTFVKDEWDEEKASKQCTTQNMKSTKTWFRGVRNAACTGGLRNGACMRKFGQYISTLT